MTAGWPSVDAQRTIPVDERAGRSCKPPDRSHGVAWFCMGEWNARYSSLNQAGVLVEAMPPFVV